MCSKIILTSFLCLILIGNIPAQITGRVVDSETGKSLAGANIYLVKDKSGATADADGLFRIENHSTDEIDTLAVNYIGYLPYKIPLYLFTNNQTLKLLPDIIELGSDIKVLGERIDLAKQEVPHLKEMFEYEELQRQGNTEISDLFKQMPSVRVEGNDIDGRQIQIRGSDADEVKVYVDGILLNTAGGGNAADLSAVASESIERLEVLKGANLLLLGNGAFGGVVNISTRRNPGKEYYIGVKSGDFRSRYFIGRMDYPITGSFHFNYMGQYSQMSPGIEYFPGERYNAKSKNDHIKSTKQNHNLNFRWFNPENQIDAKAYFYKFDYNKPNWQNNRLNYMTALALRGRILGIKDVGIFANAFFNDDQVVRRREGSGRYITDYNSNNLNLRVTKKYEYYPFELQFSGEYLHEELEQDSHLKEVEGDQSFYKAFLWDNRGSGAAVVSLSDTTDETAGVSWKTFAGIRYDILASGKSDITRAFGLQMNLAKKDINSNIHLSYGKNVKYPTLVENAYINDFIDFSSPDSLRTKLNPEFVTSVELGGDLEFKNISDNYQKLVLKAALFRSHIENKLLRQPFNEAVIQAQNGESVTTGIELSLRFHRVWGLGDISFGGNYIDISNPLLYAYKPENSLNLKFDHYSSSGFYFNFTFFHEGQSYAWYYDQNNEIVSDRINPFLDMDLTAGYKLVLNKLEMNFKFSGNNVFDSSGYKYYYLKKRYLQFALSIKY